jgi:serine/threonine protein kinase
LTTVWYSSPEVFEGDFLGQEADVWSFGIVCLEVIVNTRINKLLEGFAPPAQRSTFPADQLQWIGDEKLQKLVKKMLSPRKDKRPKMEAIIEKLDKKLNSLRRSCETQDLKLDLPLELPAVQGEVRPEWKHRV